jgi:hypothetical protein
MILRKGYKRKGYTTVTGNRVKATKVKSACIKNRGAPGKGPKILPKPKEGLLTRYGYHLDLNKEDRHAALRKAMRRYGGRSLILKLNLVRNYSKNEPTLHRKLTSDMRYVQELYKKQKKSKGKKRGGSTTRQIGGKKRRRTRSKSKKKRKRRRKSTKKKKGGRKPIVRYSGGAKKRCSKGKILRKGYRRKSYRMANGARVKATRVKAACIKNRGKPGKGPKTLPPIKRPGELKKYGYSLALPQAKRRAALRKAARKEGVLPVMRRVNLIRNYSKANKLNYKKLSQDVKYLSDLYAKEKRLHPKSIKKRRKRTKSKKGGRKRRRRTRSKKRKRRKSKKGGHIRFSTRVSYSK